MDRAAHSVRSAQGRVISRRAQADARSWQESPSLHIARRPCRHECTISFYIMGACALLHVLTFLFTHWSTRVAALVSCSKPRTLSKADKVLVVPDKFNGNMEIVSIERRTLVRLAS